MRHLKEIQRNNATTLPQKMPSKYRISLHIDDGYAGVVIRGLNGYQLDLSVSRKIVCKCFCESSHSILYIRQARQHYYILTERIFLPCKTDPDIVKFSYS